MGYIKTRISLCWRNILFVLIHTRMHPNLGCGEAGPGPISKLRHPGFPSDLENPSTCSLGTQSNHKRCSNQLSDSPVQSIFTRSGQTIIHQTNANKGIPKSETWMMGEIARFAQIRFSHLSFECLFLRLGILCWSVLRGGFKGLDEKQGTHPFGRSLN